MSPLDPRIRAVQGALRGGLPQAPSLADIFGGVQAPPPVAVSPASPAPVQPGVQVVAPTAPAPQAGLSPADQADALYASMRAQSVQRLADAEQGAQVDPQTTALLDKQDERLGEDRSIVERDGKHADWEAIANLGFTMARSNSPFFGQALAEGMQAGIKGFSANRFEKARQRALIADRADQIALARINALKAAKAEAVQKVVQGQQLTADEMRIVGMGMDQVIKKATSSSVIEQAKAAVRKEQAQATSAEFDAAHADEAFGLDAAYKRAQIGNLAANADQSRAEAAYTRAGKPGGGRRGDDGYDMKDLDKAKLEENNALAEAAGARQLWIAARNKKLGNSAGTPTAEEARIKYDVARRAALNAHNQWLAMRGGKPVTMDQYYRIDRRTGKPLGVKPRVPTGKAGDPLDIL